MRVLMGYAHMILAIIPVSKLKEMLRYNQIATLRRLCRNRMSVIAMADGQCVMALGRDASLVYR